MTYVETLLEQSKKLRNNAPHPMACCGGCEAREEIIRVAVDALGYLNRIGSGNDPCSAYISSETLAKMEKLAKEAL